METVQKVGESEAKSTQYKVKTFWSVFVKFIAMNDILNLQVYCFYLIRDDLKKYDGIFH